MSAAVALVVDGGESPSALRTLLEELVAATPPAPHPDTDCDDILVSAQSILEARRGAFVRLERAVNEDEAAILAERNACTPLYDLLREREGSWLLALRRAQRQMGERLAALRRIEQGRA